MSTPRSLASAVLLSSFCMSTWARAETVATVDPHVSAEVQSSPPKITLVIGNDTTAADITGVRIRRREGGVGPWTTLATGLAVATKRFEDTQVAVGKRYEYEVVRSSNTVVRQAWILSGIEASFEEDPGVVALVVDASLSTAAHAAIDRLAEDLRLEGWGVERVPVSKPSTPTAVRASLQALHQVHGARFRAAFLIGGIPRAFSGNLNPDGHPDHLGAWPADGYYGDLDGTWTDKETFTSAANFANVPGDGKLDPSQLPSKLEIAVGRLDTEDMPAFAPLGPSDLVVRHLDANHAFRTGATTLAERTWVTDNFGYFNGEAFARIAWRDTAAIFGKKPESGRPFFDALEDKDGYLLAFGCGGGTPTGAAGVASTTNFTTRLPKTAILGLFGSYFGDWSYPNNLMRAALIGPSPSLATFWFARPWHHVHHLGALATFGDTFRATASWPTGYDGPTPSVHMALLGDPTLRLFVVRPPDDLQAEERIGSVMLTWKPSTEASIGYVVYRREVTASVAADPWVRLTASPLATTESSFDDTTAPPLVPMEYRVVAVRLRTTASGSFLHHSAGPIALAKALAPPAVDAGLDASDLPDAATPHALTDANVPSPVTSGLGDAGAPERLDVAADSVSPDSAGCSVVASRRGRAPLGVVGLALGAWALRHKRRKR